MLSIRPATSKDVSLLNRLIHELADFERFGHEAAVSEEDLARDGFGPIRSFALSLPSGTENPPATRFSSSFIPHSRGGPGFFWTTFSCARSCEKRHRKALLDHVAGIAWREKYFCMRWEVLDWNTAAIDFYRNLGAVFMDEWKSVCLIGDALQSRRGKGKPD